MFENRRRGRYNSFSYSSKTAVVVILPNLCLWWLSLCSNLEGVHPEKHHWVTIPCKAQGWEFWSLFAYPVYRRLGRLFLIFTDCCASCSNLFLRTCGRTSTCLHHSHQHPYTASTVVYTVTFINIMNVIPLLQLIIIIIIIIFHFYFLTGNIASNIIVGSTNANL